MHYCRLSTLLFRPGSLTGSQTLTDTGGRGRGGDIGELFDDLDYFLLLRGYLQKYMPLLDFKDGRFRAGRMSLLRTDLTVVVP
jgi:hypothetical protein